MLTGIQGVDGFHDADAMRSSHDFDSQHFTTNIMGPLVENVLSKGRNSYACRLRVLRENCRVHVSKLTKQFIAQKHIMRVLQPP
jgi:hypothetical protein